jgi:hypothetical protein
MMLTPPLPELMTSGGKPLTDRTEVHPADSYRPQSYYEVKCLGPDEQVIDVSNSGWVGAH